MHFDFTQIGKAERYKLLGSTIVPRPIAWVSTMDEARHLNVAPFSFFNVFGEDPPMVGFSILHRSGDDPKDTGANIRATGEFVVNLVDEATLEAMAITAIDFGPEVDEFGAAGLSPLPSVAIRTPRIGESRVSLECKLDQIVPIGPLRSLVMGQVLAMHVADDAVLDAQRGWIDTEALRLVGRMGPNRYVRTDVTMERIVPSLEAWREARA